MLWVKAFHIMFVVAWFAGLFYLPRLFVYHCEVSDDDGYRRFCLMEKRLMTMTTIGMIGTWLLGLSLLVITPAFVHMGWLHAKLTLVLILSGYHGWLKTRVRAFEHKRNDKDARFYRLMNEVPSLLLVLIVLLVVVKPF
ncbi:MAG TPA: protoporphyrinogen oxidase HemJ [Nevskiaceae bacterium]|nr:protoporphyrinogen oxidase HemJ [Nevskiaceae bacterium]